MSELHLYPRCASPCCPAERRFSGLCEMHYWRREAERVHAELDAATTRGRELVTEAELAAQKAERALTQLARHIEDLVDNETYRTDAGWREVLTAAVTEQYAKPAAKPSLSLTRETVLNLTPRAATPPPTMAPPIDVAVEKEGKR